MLKTYPMKKHLLICLLSCLVLATSCKKKSKEADIIIDPPTPTNPASVETNPPNSNYSPAFVGQTRIGAIRTTTPYGSAVLTSALTQPLLAEFLSSRCLLLKLCLF